MSYLTNGSFEDGSTGWTLVGTGSGSVGVVPTSGDPYHGTKVAELLVGAGETIDIQSEVFDVREGDLVKASLLSHWMVEPPNVATGSTAISFFLLVWNHYLAPGVWTPIWTPQSVRSSTDWLAWSSAGVVGLAEHMKFAAGGGAVGFRFADNDAESGARRMFLDGLRVQPATALDMAKWEAMSGLITALQGINGNPVYHHDLESRVYTRELWPDANPDVKMPFLVVVENPASFDAFETYVDQTLNLSVRGFVKDTSPDVRDTSTAQAASQLHDDIVKAIRVDQTFGSTVRELTMRPVDTPPPADGWQGVEFDIGLRIIYQDSDLGP